MSRRVAIFALALAGCGELGSGTGGRAITFEMAVEPAHDMATDATFITATGWTVELHEAVVAIGPVYLFENEPWFASAGGWRDLVVPTAWAHPGDAQFKGGEVRGEYLEQVAFDLTTGHAVALGEARGIAGEVGSATVILDPPRATTFGNPASVEALRGYHAYVVGTATRGRQTVEFEGGLAIGNAEAIERKVEGVAVDSVLDDGGTLVLGVQPRVWFDQARFETLGETTADGRKWIGEDGQVGHAWYVGARSTAAFYTRWTEHETLPRLGDP
jgi:hypothetical protein